MTSSTSEKPSRSIFETPIALLIITATFYLSGFLYQCGIFDYYRIPESFIIPDLTSSLVYSRRVIGFFFISYILPYVLALAIYTFLKKAEKTIVIVQTILGTLAVLILSIWFDPPTKWYSFVLIICTGASLLFVLFISRSITKKQRIELFNNEQKDLKSTKKKQAFRDLFFPDPLNLLDLFMGGPGYKTGLFILITIIVCLSYPTGKQRASSVNIYLAPANSSKYVIVTKSGDMLIMKSFDEKTKRLGNDLTLIKPDATMFIEKSLKLLPPEPVK